MLRERTIGFHVEKVMKVLSLEGELRWVFKPKTKTPAKYCNIVRFMYVISNH